MLRWAQHSGGRLSSLPPWDLSRPPRPTCRTGAKLGRSPQGATQTLEGAFSFAEAGKGRFRVQDGQA
eukprot:633524-Pyramimonas_sp.AAC.1